MDLCSATAPERSCAPGGSTLARFAEALLATPPPRPDAVLTEVLTGLLPTVPPAQCVVLTAPCVTAGRFEIVVARDAAHPTEGQRGAVALTAPLAGGPDSGSLTFYADAPFGAEAVRAATEAAAVCSVAVAALTERLRADHLEKALVSSRQIAAAVGIVMAQHRCTYEEAFLHIKAHSQRGHRKLRELADDIVFTGEVPGPVSRPSAPVSPRERVETSNGPASAQREPAPPRGAGGSPAS